jgi:uncharacterized membrane protein (UPF0136 family)
LPFLLDPDIIGRMKKNSSDSIVWRVLFGSAVFLSAFLLFQVQPLLGRFLVPWFGGTPEVWTACMLFFQLFLLLGYGYAHVLSRRLAPRRQALVHLFVLAVAAALAFRIVPGEGLKPTPQENPIVHILWICTFCIGLPYFILSATGPLLQAWISRLGRGQIPYRFYALSNAGSLLALLSYPFVFEPLLGRRQQAALWSVGFVLFAGLCGLCALRLFQKSWLLSDIPPTETQPTERICMPSRSIRFLWLALPAAASVELLAVTTKITQDIAVVPFLWILPLCLYLLSFILCFDRQRWYIRPLFLTLFILSIVGVIAARFYEEQTEDVRILIGLYTFMLFCCCMVCHGELYALRPHPAFLTGYYLRIAGGGAIGGFFVAVAAPLLFKTYIELHLGLIFCVILIVIADRRYLKGFRRKSVYVTLLLVVGVAGIFLMGKRTAANQRAIEQTRSFFGVLTVWEDDWNDPQRHKRLLQHGTTYHGLQFQSPEKRSLPTAYYGFSSGIGMLIQAGNKQGNRRIGVVGLGVGTIAFYGKPSDTICFYEINPQVRQMAEKYFTYLADSKAKIEIIFGDGRLSLEHQPPQNYDILVLDAFSSDAVPVHLLTCEAFEIYLKHLAPGGALAFHISSMHLDLPLVLWKMAEHFHLSSLWLETFDDSWFGALSSDWIILSPSKELLDKPLLQGSASKPYGNLDKIDLWTDDHLNLLQILKRHPAKQKD